MVVLLPPAHEHVVGYLVAMGVHGVGLRAGDPEELGTLVDAALKGAQMVAPTLHGALAGSVKPRPLAEREEALLTSREREVLVLSGRRPQQPRDRSRNVGQSRDGEVPLSAHLRQA